MNLLFVEPRPDFVGGSERFTLDLCRYASRQGHKTVLAYADAGDMVPAYESAGTIACQVPVRPWNFHYPGAVLESLRALRALVATHRIHVAFSSHLWLGSCLAAVRATTAARTAMHLGLAIVPSRLNAAGLRRIDLRIAPSDHVADYWRQGSLRHREVRVIPNGVDLAEFRPDEASRSETRRRLGLDDATRVVAYVGRIAPEKGVFTMIDAVGRVAQASQERVFLMLVGSLAGTTQSELEIAARHAGLDGRWMRQPPTARPADIYRAADVSVVPSEWDEPFGLAALESMACGVVAVVSDAGVLPRLACAGGTDAVFPAGNPNVLASRIRYWLGNDLARKAAARAMRTHVAENYSQDLCGSRYLAAFDGVVNR